MQIPQEDKEVLMTIGVALLLLQATEKVIRLCMTFVLQKTSSLTLESLLGQEDSERTKTLGYFLAQLRKRTDLDAEFDALLTDFLRNRNDFIHDLSRIPGWVEGSSERIAIRRQFVHGLIRQSDTVL